MFALQRFQLFALVFQLSAKFLTFAAHLTLFAAVSMVLWQNIIHYYTIVIQQ